jgi:hypothetical protein
MISLYIQEGNLSFKQPSIVRCGHPPYRIHEEEKESYFYAVIEPLEGGTGLIRRKDGAHLLDDREIVRWYDLGNGDCLGGVSGV